MEKTKENFLIRLWKYFTLYEKIWLFTFCTAGIVLAILFPEETGWVRILEVITLIGGCTCELLISKQSKWCFIVSFFFYDLTTTVVYFVNGYYVSAIFEVIFWMPILFVSFFSWDKRKDEENQNLTKVKQIDLKKDALIFVLVLISSLIVAGIISSIGFLAEGFSDYWYVDVLANSFSVCNGLFLWLRYKEQWIAWLGVCLCEAVMWILSGNYIMLLLSLGYLTNSTYGLIMWTRYCKNEKQKKGENEKQNINSEKQNINNEEQTTEKQNINNEK